MSIHERLVELDLIELLSGVRPPDLTARVLARLKADEDCRTVPAGPENRPHAVSESAGALPGQPLPSRVPRVRRLAELVLVCGVLGLCAWLLWPQPDPAPGTNSSSAVAPANEPQPQLPPEPAPPVAPLRQWALAGVDLQGVFILESAADCARLSRALDPKLVDWQRNMLIVACAPVGDGSGWNCELQPRAKAMAHLEIVAAQRGSGPASLSAVVFEMPRATFDYTARLTIQRNDVPELVVDTPAWRLLEVAIGVGSGVTERRAELIRTPEAWASLFTGGELPSGTRLAKPLTELGGTRDTVDDAWTDSGEDILAICAGEFPASLKGYLLYDGIPGWRRLTFWKEPMGQSKPTGLFLLVKVPREAGKLVVDLQGNEPVTIPRATIEIER